METWRWETARFFHDIIADWFPRMNAVCLLGCFGQPLVVDQLESSLEILEQQRGTFVKTSDRTVKIYNTIAVLQSGPGQKLRR